MPSNPSTVIYAIRAVMIATGTELGPLSRAVGVDEDTLSAMLDPICGGSALLPVHVVVRIAEHFSVSPLVLFGQVQEHADGPEGVPAHGSESNLEHADVLAAMEGQFVTPDVPECPAWCVQPPGHGWDGFLRDSGAAWRMHYATPPAHGWCVAQDEGWSPAEGFTFGPVEFTNADSEATTVEAARQLIAELHVAIDAFETLTSER